MVCAAAIDAPSSTAAGPYTPARLINTVVVRVAVTRACVPHKPDCITDTLGGIWPTSTDGRPKATLLGDCVLPYTICCWLSQSLACGDVDAQRTVDSVQGQRA